MAPEGKFDLGAHPVHLGLGATVVVQPEYEPEMEWFMAYGLRHAGDGTEGRLVLISTYEGPWSTWEQHPHGEELVACLSGAITLHQELDGGVRTVTLGPGEAVINPRGVWHTADVDDTATVLFITAGAGTENRPR